MESEEWKDILEDYEHHQVHSAIMSTAGFIEDEGLDPYTTPVVIVIDPEKCHKRKDGLFECYLGNAKIKVESDKYEGEPFIVEDGEIKEVESDDMAENKGDVQFMRKCDYAVLTFDE